MLPGLCDFTLVTHGLVTSLPGAWETQGTTVLMVALLSSFGWGLEISSPGHWWEGTAGRVGMPRVGDGQEERETLFWCPKTLGQVDPLPAPQADTPNVVLRAQQPHGCHFIRHHCSSGELT